MERRFCVEGNTGSLELRGGEVCYETLKSMIICRLRQMYGEDARQDFAVEGDHLSFLNEEKVIPLSAIGINYKQEKREKYVFFPAPKR